MGNAKTTQTSTRDLLTPPPSRPQSWSSHLPLSAAASGGGTTPPASHTPATRVPFRSQFNSKEWKLLLPHPAPVPKDTRELRSHNQTLVWMFLSSKFSLAAFLMNQTATFPTGGNSHYN